MRGPEWPVSPPLPRMQTLAETAPKTRSSQQDRYRTPVRPACWYCAPQRSASAVLSTWLSRCTLKAWAPGRCIGTLPFGGKLVAQGRQRALGRRIAGCGSNYLFSRGVNAFSWQEFFQTGGKPLLPSKEYSKCSIKRAKEFLKCRLHPLGRVCAGTVDKASCSGLHGQAEKFWAGLLRWHCASARRFPWRETRDPYHILVAEILLQKTAAAAVPKVYEKLISFYPTPKDLASAALDDIAAVVAVLGLGYRADRLRRTAEILASEYGGSVPCSREALLALPGVGPYIADAVLCYAFGLPVVPVDTNTVRVAGRALGIRSDKSRPRTDRLLAQKLAELLLPEKARDCNLALLDFAALVCTARKPKCAECFWEKDCSSRVGHVQPLR